MKYIAAIVAILVSIHSIYAGEENDSDVPGGLAPDGKMEVVNIHNGEGGYFVIRDASGAVLFTEKSIENKYSGFALFAWKALWRSDSRYVAIGFQTTKFAVETIVLRRNGNGLEQIEMPEIDPFDDAHAEFGSSDNTHRMPYKWRKNGNLVMDITTGYHTLSDGGITGYFATLHFSGEPPKATVISKSKVTARDD